LNAVGDEPGEDIAIATKASKNVKAKGEYGHTESNSDRKVQRTSNALGGRKDRRASRGAKNEQFLQG
jgi:hypothetical protein